MKIPIVSIIGKPNVGKSTLFNRIVGQRLAIEADVPGTTRDRIFYRVENPTLDFFLVDTGGIEAEKATGHIEINIQSQTRLAIEESDLIVFVVDGRVEPTRDDLHAADLLRKVSDRKTVILVANKCDSEADAERLFELYRLGLDKPMPVSATHGTGVAQLIKKVVQGLKSRSFLTKDSEEYQKIHALEAANINIALVGKPNVGKSSIVNALLGQEKLIVSDIPGTTRDSTDSVVRHNQRLYNVIDTAGMRRAKNVEGGIEHFSVLRSLSAIERADVAVLVLDSSQKVTDQDQQIANAILKSTRGAIILANKWDIKVNPNMTEEQRQSTFVAYLQKKFGFMPWAPVIFASAKNRKNLTLIFELAQSIVAERKKRIPTASLNHCIEDAVSSHAPTGTKRFAPKVFYATQISEDPPRFVLFVNKEKYFHFSYLRYLERKLRDKFGFEGTPILMEFSEKESRYSEEK